MEKVRNENSMNNRKNKYHWLYKGGGVTNYKLQTIGNREVIIEGCKGVLHYQKDEIRLNVGTGEVRFWGENLSIPVLERNLVQIEGEIVRIELI